MSLLNTLWIFDWLFGDDEDDGDEEALEEELRRRRRAAARRAKALRQQRAREAFVRERDREVAAFLAAHRLQAEGYEDAPHDSAVPFRGVLKAIAARVERMAAPPKAEAERLARLRAARRALKRLSKACPGGWCSGV